MHVQLAANPLGKPLVLEEFGSTWWCAAGLAVSHKHMRRHEAECCIHP